MKPIAVLLITAALSLSGQDAAFGVRVHGLQPMGDLKDLTNNQVGLGAAVFISIPHSGGLVLRPVLGMQYIPQGNTTGLPGTKTAVTSVDLMLDLLWFPNEDPDHGPYLVGSVGGQQWRLTANGTAPSTQSATRLGLGGGLGYQLSPRLGVEARGFWSPVEQNLKATGLIIGATLRF
ncbi:MAG: hypothetical protein HGB30_00685 [Holophagaceae bacterium]|nr:hypothetical protein [Holophagaceae bacterium]